MRATERRLEQIYNAAFLGLKGDALALAAGMRPSEYAALCESDPVAREAEVKGRADSEMAHARKLYEASMSGDSKASLAILQHVHGWSSKDAQVADFSNGGITIVIGDVQTHRVIDAAPTRIDAD